MPVQCIYIYSHIIIILKDSVVIFVIFTVFIFAIIILITIVSNFVVIIIIVIIYHTKCTISTEHILDHTNILYHIYTYMYIHTRVCIYYMLMLL